jgi:hypothetical protein
MKRRRYKVAQAVHSVREEGSRTARPATSPAELLTAFVTLTALLKQEVARNGDNGPLGTILARTLPLLLREGFRMFGMPFEVHMWLEVHRSSASLDGQALLGPLQAIRKIPERSGLRRR